MGEENTVAEALPARPAPRFMRMSRTARPMVALARKQNDYITINFLQWFLTEQLEEVSSMDNLLKIVQRAGTNVLQADEYLARVGVRTMPEPPNE